MLTTTSPPQRSARRELLVGWWSRSALVAIVIVLGLLQGSRAALGDIELGSRPEAAAETKAETPGAGAREQGALHGRFFRPADSSAVRPALRLRQSRWSPAEVERLALACPDPSC
jgi:hypothetical protein